MSHTIEQMLDENTTSITLNDVELQFYRELSNKADTTIAQIYTAVGVALTVFSLFGVLIAFKAPNDLQKQMSILQQDLEKAKNYAANSELNSKLVQAHIEDSTTEQIEIYTGIISQYPNNPKAYLQRGYAFLKAAEPDKAISDFEIANLHGLSKVQYLGAMGMAMSQKGSHEKAVHYFSEAIDIKPSSSLFNRRACSLADLNRFPAALNDFDSALKLKSEDCAVLVNRSLVYAQMVKVANTDEEMLDYEVSRITDIKAAEALKSEDEQIQAIISRDKENIRRAKSLSILDRTRISTYMKIELATADEFRNKNKHAQAIELYDNILYYIPEAYEGTAEFKDFVRRIGEYGQDIYLNHSDLHRCFEYCRLFAYLTSNNTCIVGYNKYCEKEYGDAAQLFSAAIELCETNDNARINLAFMARREEVTLEGDILEFLEQCHSSTQAQAVWVINYVLEGMKRNNLSYTSACRKIQGIKEGLDEAVSWWNQTELVGDEELNCILLLLEDNGIECDAMACTPHVDIHERLQRAIKDGYVTPDAILQTDEICLV